MFPLEVIVLDIQIKTTGYYFLDEWLPKTEQKVCSNGDESADSSCIAGPQSCKTPGAGQVELRAGQNAVWAVSTQNSQTLSVLEETMSQASIPGPREMKGPHLEK